LRHYRWEQVRTGRHEAGRSECHPPRLACSPTCSALANLPNASPSPSICLSGWLACRSASRLACWRRPCFVSWLGAAAERSAKQTQPLVCIRAGESGWMHNNSNNDDYNSNNDRTTSTAKASARCSLLFLHEPQLEAFELLALEAATTNQHNAS